MVSTLDSESSDPGSNPGRTSLLPTLNAHTHSFPFPSSFSHTRTCTHTHAHTPRHPRPRTAFPTPRCTCANHVHKRSCRDRETHRNSSRHSVQKCGARRATYALQVLVVCCLLFVCWLLLFVVVCCLLYAWSGVERVVVVVWLCVVLEE